MSIKQDYKFVENYATSGIIKQSLQILSFGVFGRNSKVWTALNAQRLPQKQIVLRFSEGQRF